MRTLKTFAVVGSMVALGLGVLSLPAHAAPAVTESASYPTVRSADPGGGPVTPQSPADCLYYLNLAGYASTPARVTACNADWELNCFVGLINTGVSQYHAGNACELKD